MMREGRGDGEGRGEWCNERFKNTRRRLIITREGHRRAGCHMIRRASKEEEDPTRTPMVVRVERRMSPSHEPSRLVNGEVSEKKLLVAAQPSSNTSRSAL